MRFVDLLRTTVLLCAGAATTLAVVCIIGASRDVDEQLVLYATAWWIIAAILGSFVGRRNEATPPIAKLLANAKAATMMPEQRPGAVVLNRLWPLLLTTIVAGAVAFLAPQVPGIAAGFMILWALAWRRQDQAVRAIEERDGVQFYVDRTSPVQPIRLMRVPGLRREVPTLDGVPRP
ncbi:MAG: hypothetical protein JWN65_3107 [Solirubrobacterales bacterium]|nr:hypothetical protein [Solirubrobacterales bacterium]